MQRIDRLGASVFSDACKGVAQVELVRRLRRELIDRSRLRAHEEQEEGTWALETNFEDGSEAEKVPDTAQDLSLIHI